METLARSANRGSISTGGYDIANSLKLEKNNSEYLYRTFSSGNNKTWTWSGWVKRTLLVGDTDGGTLFDSHFNLTRYFFIHFYQDKIQIYNYNGGIDYGKVTRQVFRDMSAWYHVVLAMDTTQSTEADRMKLYVNGTQITEFETNHGDFPLNYDTEVNKAQNHYIGYRPDSTLYSSQYMSEINFVDGQQLAPTEFAEVDEDSGIWKAKAYTGTYGTNGFYTKFDNASDLGEDASGGSSFTLNNITSADQATDTPTNNFATMNPLWNYYNEVSRVTISDGGTRLTGNQSNTLWRGIPATIPVTSGKWYWEVERGYGGNGILVGYGSTENIGWRELTTIAGTGSAKMMYSYNGDIYGYDSNEDNRAQYVGNYNTLGDIISIALDLDNGWAYTRYNGAAWHSSGNPSSGSTGTGGISVPWSPAEPTVFIVTIPNNLQDTRVNFGGYTTTANTLQYADGNGYGAFKYAVPSGYYALCSKNLAEFG